MKKLKHLFYLTLLLSGQSSAYGIKSPDWIAKHLPYLSREDRKTLKDVIKHNLPLQNRIADLKGKIVETKSKITYNWYYGCADGWNSPSLGKSGACSDHGGVVSYSYCKSGCELLLLVQKYEDKIKVLKRKAKEVSFLGYYGYLTSVEFLYRGEKIVNKEYIACVTSNKPVMSLETSNHGTLYIVIKDEYKRHYFNKHITEFSEDIEQCLGYQPYQN